VAGIANEYFLGGGVAVFGGKVAHGCQLASEVMRGLQIAAIK
jgi:hypothetical protein